MPNEKDEPATFRDIIFLFIMLILICLFSSGSYLSDEPSDPYSVIMFDQERFK